MNTNRLTIKFAYDGSYFYGFARQPGLTTVEGVLIRALKELGAIQNPRDAKFCAASRTDKGVNALGNVCAFDTNFPEDVILSALNSKLQHCWIWGKKKVPSGFSPGREALKRRYTYSLPLGEVFPERSKTYNVSIMEAAAQVFVGKHNFWNFCKHERGKETVSEIDSIHVYQLGDFLRVDFTARVFLWEQIRKIVSALVSMAKGKVSKGDVERLLESPKREPPLWIKPYPPEGLLLVDVDFGFKFEKDEAVLKKILAELNEEINAMNLYLSLYNEFLKGIQA